jgi:spermidine synthase
MPHILSSSLPLAAWWAVPPGRKRFVFFPLTIALSMNRSQVLLLMVNVLVIAACGLVYELLAGAVASYLLGDSITQFSTVIGVYLFAMGIGAWLSRFVGEQAAWCFIEVELAVALVGGISAPLLFLGNVYLPSLQIVLYVVVFLIGALVGLEIPLLMRILKDNLEFKDLVSQVLTFDYVGALVASLAFPLVLMPRFGPMRTSLMIGLLNAIVALWATWLLRSNLKGNLTLLRIRTVLLIVALCAGVFFSNQLVSMAEEEQYGGERVVMARSTPYQRIVITRSSGGSFKLHLNGHLQFSSLDEYRYHEALVHPAMLSVKSPERVLIMGGGDGLAMREVLRYPSVKKVKLVDLDPGMTRLSERYSQLAMLNEYSYRDSRVEVENMDAYIWVQREEEDSKPYDVVIIDFPDPHNFSLGKLYTSRFYRLLKKKLAPDAAIGIQCTSPLWAPKTFWCIVRTMEAAGFKVKPYHVAVPTFFGIWGYSLAKQTDFEPPTKAPRNLRRSNGDPVRLRFLNDSAMLAMFSMPVDLELPPGETVEVNSLNNQSVVNYHDSEWRRFAR